MSLIITKAKLMEIIKEEVEEALDPQRTLATQAEDEYEEPEYQGLRPTDVIGAGAGEWKTSSDAQGAPQRPPQEHQDEAVRLLASYILEPTIGKLPPDAPIQLLTRLLDRKGISQQAIDILGWELYNKAMEGPTRADGPRKKPALIKRISARLKQIVAEELETYLTEVYSEEQRTYMCTQANLPDSERKKGLSKAQAEEMCRGPMKES